MAFSLLFLLAGPLAEAGAFLQPSTLKPLDNGAVYSACQDSSGALWFNTSYGLLRYNGHSLDTYHRPMPMHPIVYGDGCVYGPTSTSLQKLDTGSGSLVSITRPGVDFTHCALYADDSVVLLGSERDIYKVVADSLLLWTSVGEGSSVGGIARFSDSKWIVSVRDSGLHVLEDSGRLTKFFDLPDAVSALHVSEDGTIWAGLTAGGMVSIRPDSPDMRVYSSLSFDGDVPAREVRTFCSDGSGGVYAGSVDGLFHVDVDGKCSRVIFDSNLSTAVCSLFIDRDGGMWVTTFYSGVFYLNSSSYPFESVSAGDVKLVNDMVEDKRSDLWIFTDGFGMYRYDGGSFERIPSGDGMKFKSAAYDPSLDCIWAGEYMGDLLRYDIASGKWRKYRFLDGRGNPVRLSLNDILVSSDTLQLGTTSGLYLFDKRRDSEVSTRVAGYDRIVFSMSLDNSGILWIGGNGLYTWKAGDCVRHAFDPDGDFKVFNNAICGCVRADADGGVWVSVVGSGVSRVGPDRSVTRYNKAVSGVSDNYTSEVEKVADSLLLVGTRSGLSLLDPGRGVCFNYSPSNGLGLSSTRDGCLLRRSDGSYWIGGTDGIGIFHPERVNMDSGSAEISFDRLLVGAPSSESQCWSRVPETIRLKPGQRNFSIDMASFDYAGVLYRSCEYSFSGVNEDWIPFDESKPLDFMNIRPGKYRLRVRCSTAPGVSCTREVMVVARAWWWAGTAAIIIYLLLALGVVTWILYAAYTHMRLSQQLKSTEQENEERTRFFIRISHELRTPLALTIGQLELFFRNNGHDMPGAANLEKSYRNAKKMDEIITGFVEIENDFHKVVEHDVTLMDESQGEPDQREEGAPGKKYRMLVVDDNHDMRSLFRSIFSSDYDLTTACDGKEGYEKALELTPDIIISDVNMPRMDGITMCSKLRQNLSTCHIPILLITAHASEKHTLEGMEQGADGYITKPFNVGLLEARCRNLLENRRLLREKYTTTVEGPAAAGVTDVKDMHFINAAIAVVERNLFTEDLNVPKLCRELSISKSSLTMRLEELTGFTPRDFIEDIRLKHAAQMLLDGKSRVSDVSYELGFSSPRYFAIRFKKKFGQTPSEYASSGQNSQDQRL